MRKRRHWESCCNHCHPPSYYLSHRHPHCHHPALHPSPRTGGTQTDGVMLEDNLFRQTQLGDKCEIRERDGVRHKLLTRSLVCECMCLDNWTNDWTDDRRGLHSPTLSTSFHIMISGKILMLSYHPSWQTMLMRKTTSDRENQ